MADNKKYYWLKLQKDFFKRHDIRIVEGMPNGKDYILFYLKLLVESITNYGHLRFSDTIPYTDEMLSIITNTNIDIVRSAIKLFSELKMIQTLDDQTIFMTEIEKMVGSETVWAEKKRQYRLQRQKDNVPMLSETKKTESDKSLDIDIDIDIDKEKDIYMCADKPQTQKHTIDSTPQMEIKAAKKLIEAEKRKSFIPPTVGEIIDYCNERKNKVDAQRFLDFYESKGWMIGKNKMKDWKAAIRTWERNSNQNTSSNQKSSNPFLEMLQEELSKEGTNDQG